MLCCQYSLGNLGTRVNRVGFGYVWQGKFDLNPDTCGRGNFLNPDTCGQGVRCFWKFQVVVVQNNREL